MRPANLAIDQGLTKTSKFEIQLGCEINRFFALDTDKKARQFKSEKGGYYTADLLLKDFPIIVEFDSCFCHSSERRYTMDAQKNKTLQQKGFQVVRLRESPLKKISDNDVIVAERPKVFPVAVLALQKIQEVLRQQGYKLSGAVSRAIDKYVKAGVLQAASEADQIIDRHKDFVSIDKREARAKTLSDLFGNDRWRTANGHLVSISSEDIQKKKLFLDALFGNSKWRAHPTLIGRTEDALKERAAFLSKLLGNDKWKRQPTLLTRDPAVLADNAANLNKIVGSGSWEKYPQLLSMAPTNVDDKSHALADIFQNDLWKQYPLLLSHDTDKLKDKGKKLQLLVGDTWKKSPNLLTQNVAILEEHAVHLDKTLGNRKWKTHPRLLTLPAETVNAKARVLTELLGHENWKNAPALLSYNSETLKDKSEVIDTMVGSSSWKSMYTFLSKSVVVLGERRETILKTLGEEQGKLYLKDSPSILGATEKELHRRLKKRKQLIATR